MALPIRAGIVVVALLVAGCSDDTEVKSLPTSPGGGSVPTSTTSPVPGQPGGTPTTSREGGSTPSTTHGGSGGPTTLSLPPGTPPPTTTSTVPRPIRSPGEPADVVGSLEVLVQKVMIDGQRAASDGIAPGALLSTDDRGAGLVRFKRHPASCEIRPRSAAYVAPAANVLLRHVRGSTICDQRKKTGARTRIQVRGATVELLDATVRVTDDGRIATVRVIRGRAHVTSPGRTDDLVPGQETTVM